MNKISDKELKCTVMAATLAIAGASLATQMAHAASPKVKIYEKGNERCIMSNGVPNHSIGQFPNAGNPNSFKTQSLEFCFDKNPQKGSTPTYNTPNVGIALNGIVIRPGTADWYDASSPRGFSRDRSSGWNLEGMGSASQLGIDQNNAHVDNRGLYHYHGPPPNAVRKGTLIGYAADGFEIHYVGPSAVPSWHLKKGTRPSAPGGQYDGKFLQDWEHKEGTGNLDQCNGTFSKGKYVYFATETFPFYPRCHFGRVSDDFKLAGGGQHAVNNNAPARKGGPLAGAAAELGISEHQLAQAVGPPPPNVKRAAKILGISEAKLRQVLKKHRP